MTKIKNISNNRYEVVLSKDQYNMYTIVYTNKAFNKTNTSEKISSFEQASQLFDIKAKEVFGKAKLKG